MSTSEKLLIIIVLPWEHFSLSLCTHLLRKLQVPFRSFCIHWENVSMKSWIVRLCHCHFLLLIFYSNTIINQVLFSKDNCSYLTKPRAGIIRNWNYWISMKYYFGPLLLKRKKFKIYFFTAITDTVFVFNTLCCGSLFCRHSFFKFERISSNQIGKVLLQHVVTTDSSFSLNRSFCQICQNCIRAK